MDSFPQEGSKAPTTLTELHNAVLDVHMVIGELEKRLQPVLNPAPQKDNTNEVRESTGHLREAVDGVDAARRRLRNLLDNLAV